MATTITITVTDAGAEQGQAVSAAGPPPTLAAGELGTVGASATASGSDAGDDAGPPAPDDALGAAGAGLGAVGPPPPAGALGGAAGEVTGGPAPDDAFLAGGAAIGETGPAPAALEDVPSGAGAASAGAEAPAPMALDELDRIGAGDGGGDLASLRGPGPGEDADEEG